MPGLIKAIIFDWGGVLVEDPIPQMIEYCSKILKVGKEELEKALPECRPDFERGAISEEVFWKRICRSLSIPDQSMNSLWSHSFESAYKENREMFSLASSLRQNGYKIGLLSNTEVPAVEYFREKGYEIFDATVFSCLEGMRKPEKGIYDIALDKLGVRPEEAIFIDDKEANVKGAERAGINAILFRDPGQVKRELSAFMVKTVSP